MSVRKISYMGLFLAICLVGAHLKWLGSIAFDAAPAFLGGLVLGPGWGAVLGGLGHLLSALLAGFPLGVPLHGIVSFIMATAVYLCVRCFMYLGSTGVKAYLAAGMSAYAINVGLGLLAAYAWLGPGVCVLVWPLSAAAVCNISLALAGYYFLPPQVKKGK